MNAIRWSVVTVCLSVLTACGGGGPDKEPEADAPLSASYAVTQSDSTYSIYGAQLDIVDPSSAELLRSVQVDRADAWVTTLSRSLSADGRSLTMQHEVALYYIDSQRVRAVDLTRGSTTQPRQVSSLADACRVLWHLDSDLTGKDSWLAIVRAGADGDCETGADDEFALVHSSTAATDTANAGPFSLPDLVTSGYNAAGQLNRLITFERNEGQFVQWQPADGLARSAVTNGGGIPANADVRWLGWLPGFQDKGIVQINGTLRMLSWNDAGATLSASLASGVVPFGPFVAADASRLYVVAGQTSQVILAFDSTGTATQVATLNEDKGAATALMVSNDALWVAQKDEAATTTPSTLTSIAKTTGDALVVDRYDVPDGLPSDLGLTLVGVNGPRLVYAKPADQDDDDAIGFHVVDSANGAPRVLAPRVQGIGWQQNPTALIGQTRAITQVIWCDIGTPATPTGCAATRFKGYNLATGVITPLGPQMLNADASAVVEYAFIGSQDGQSALISTTAVSYSDNNFVSNVTTRLWQFKPDVANSLRFIVGTSSSGASSGSSGGSSGGSTSSGSVTSTLTFVTSE